MNMSSSARGPRIGRTVRQFLTWLVPLSAIAAEPAATVAQPVAAIANLATIHLVNQDYLAGQLVDSPDGGIARLGALAGFCRHFYVRSAGKCKRSRFPRLDKTVQPEGGLLLRIARRQRCVLGSLVAFTAEEATIEVPDSGEMRVERNAIRRMYRLHGADLLFVGPAGLEGWRQAGNAPWQEKGAALVANGHGATIYRDFGLPAQVRIEVEMSWDWQEKPDFKLAMGVGPDPKAAERAFRFEVWENTLVVVRENRHEADLATVQKLESGRGRLHVGVFLDQTQGRLRVFSIDGKQLADLTVANAKPQVFGGLEISQKSGEICLERLCIRRWNGELPSKRKRKRRPDSKDWRRDGSWRIAIV